MNKFVINYKPSRGEDTDFNGNYGQNETSKFPKFCLYIMSVYWDLQLQFTKKLPNLLL